MIIIRLEEDVLLWARVGKGDGVFLHDLGHVPGHLAFSKNGGCLGLPHNCEKQWCWLISPSVANKLILGSLPVHVILDDTRPTSCRLADNNITKTISCSVSGTPPAMPTMRLNRTDG
jgi:hypothetical protein